MVVALLVIAPPPLFELEKGPDADSSPTCLKGTGAEEEEEEEEEEEVEVEVEVGRLPFVLLTAAASPAAPSSVKETVFDLRGAPVFALLNVIFAVHANGESAAATSCLRARSTSFFFRRLCAAALAGI